MNEELSDELAIENLIPGFRKLPYPQRKNFLEEITKKDLKSLRAEIELAIKALENDNPQKNQNNPSNNKTGISKESKILL